jgi:hypothetical protein
VKIWLGIASSSHLSYIGITNSANDMNIVEQYNQKSARMLQYMFTEGSKHSDDYAVHFVALTALARSSAYISNPKIAASELLWEMDQSTQDQLYRAWELAYTECVSYMNVPHDYDAVRKNYRKV